MFGKINTISDSGLVILTSSIDKQFIKSKDIEEIKVAPKNKTFLGALIGGAAGVGLMFLVQAAYEAPHTESGSSPGRSWTVTERKIMPIEYKIPIVMGGTAIGVLIGSKNKGWKQIY